MKHDAGSTDWIEAFYTAAVEWWGESWYEGENLADRLALVQCYGVGKRVLELAAGTGETAAYLCEHGYSVHATDLCDANIALMKRMQSKYPKLQVSQGDHHSVSLPGGFGTVCMFEAFGIGTDAEQRVLLRRIASEWLSDDGVAILDVYHPYMPIRANGTSLRLDRLPDVPGSVDMTEYSKYDPMHGRWIDVWEPRNKPEASRIQSIRCYTPADLLLLLEGTGLSVRALLFKGKELNWASNEVSDANPFDNEDRQYSYVAVLGKAR